jgi:aconitate hydratase
MESTPEWEEIAAPGGARFAWDDTSGFIRPSPFPQMGPVATLDGPIRGICPLLVLGDAVTTDHIAPNGAIQAGSPAGRWLIEQGESPAKLGNFGLRRGNPEVCGRGMFDNPLLSNALASGRGNRTVHCPSGDEVSVWEAGRRYVDEGVSTIVIAGAGYGAGSSRDWAAKGLRLLGVVAVLAESFERIHRANLIGVGVLPLEVAGDVGRSDFPLDGGALIDLDLPETGLAPGIAIPVRVSRDGEELARFEARLAARSAREVALIAAGGILPAMRAELAAKASKHG